MRISTVVASVDRLWRLADLGSGGLYISPAVTCTSWTWWLVHLGRGALYISAVGLLPNMNLHT